MKKCSYCGKEYPDDATICVIDHEPLIDEAAVRTNVTGFWRGVYGYGERETRPGHEPVAFTLRLEQGRRGHFTGSVAEDAPHGAPGTGTILGDLSSSTIEFTKRMPVGYVAAPDGGRMTLREYFVARGQDCAQELPAPAIFYQGTFLDPNRVQGTWMFHPRQARLPAGLVYPTAWASGFWCAEFMTADPNTEPAGGPKQPLFDKSLLSPQELELAEEVLFLSVGTFQVEDTRKLMQRFDEQNLRYRIECDEAAIRQLLQDAETAEDDSPEQMIELVVHPDDEERALQIISGEQQA